ncbi:Acidic mammalian chitinase [Pseudolycoriella hygida]|uniref:chitinase n=1 Tax=Pseudolycoriella hygida TaxID=35572 RepID=A0A9Q0RY42_9DIPT|nr:Acidic mammalian chitinase [Pseudolycoriella hygida]
MFPLGKAVTSWTLLFFTLMAQFHTGKTEGRVVCYYTNWSVYRPGTAKFNPQNINPYLCTHLVYAFGGFTKDNTLKTFDKYQDIEQGGYAKFNGLKTFNKELKTMLAIGGWNEGSTRFSSLVASPQRRQEFVKNIIKFLRQNHFDGLDLDWEYPSFRGGKPRDRENYAQFVQELREEFELESSKTGRPRLLVTMAVPAGIEYIKNGYDVKKLNKYLDWFNLLSYDYHSAFEPSVNHHAPLYSLEEESEYNYDSELNIDFSIKYYLNEGADRDKLVLGIPTYGRTYTLLNEDVTDIGAPTDGPGAQGDATREKGYLSYYEICQNIMEDPDWTVVQPDENKMGPYAFKGNLWVGYDDENIAKKKGEYVVANGLGGVMFWSLDNDDFRGLCHKRPYPIIEAAKEAMLNALGLGDNEVVGPSNRKKPSRQRSRNTNKIQTQTKDDEEIISSNSDTSRRPQTNRRRPSTTTERYSESRKPVSRTTTPEPPTTPDPGADFKCEDEGFYPHPRDCKKYFWCLDSGPSNLGIVAHQFTCPSGLVFNKITDSCDYTRNVQCTTKTSASTTTTIRPTTNEAVTTSSKPRTTWATSRSTFIKRPTTTADTRLIDEEEYIDEDEEDPKQLTGEEEEDPKVLKELIDIIKKLGGLEQLEKQLRQQGDAKTEESPTAPTLISKSLYEKVLNSATGRNLLPNSRYTSTSTFGRNNSDSSNNKYSSVIRNSRPGPQNSGLERQDEVDTIQERPKYVTINRQSLSSKNKKEEKDDNIEDEESDEREASFGYTTSQPQYVNIQRTRPSTTKSSIEEISDDEVESSTRRQYETLNRGKPFAVQNVDEESVTITTNRYKTIHRTRPSEATEQPGVSDTPLFISQGQQLMVSENDPVLTNTPETTTRTYANFARRTTETVTELNEQRTSPTQILYKDLTDATERPEMQTELPEFITVTADIDYTIDNNQNEVTTRTNDLDTYSPTLINSNPNTPTNRPTSSVDISNDKTDQNKKFTTNTITTVGSFSKETQESIDSQTISPEFHGIVSSPRPFEFSKRTRRPAVRFTSLTVPTTSTTETSVSPVNKVSSFAYVASNPRRTIANLLLQRRENEAKVEQDQVSGFTTVDDSSESQELNVDTTRYIESSSSASPNASPSSTAKYEEDSHETFDNSFSRPNRYRPKLGNRDETVTRPTTSRRQFASTEASVDEVTQSRRTIPRRKLRPIIDEDTDEGPKQTTKTIVRPLRPTIESDLSSLTAADFNKYSFVPKNTVRRIWPTRTTTTSTTVDYSNVDSNASDNGANSVRSSGRRRLPRPSTERTVNSRIVEHEGNKIARVTLQRPLGRRRPTNADQPYLDALSQTEDYSNSDSDSASNSQHFTISQDDFTEENVVTTNAPLKLTLERKLSFGAADNRFDAEKNHRVKINKYVSDSPIIFLNSRSTTISPILHTQDAEQVSVRTDSSTLLNPLIYSLVIDNAHSDDVSTQSINSAQSVTSRPNLRRPSYRTRNPPSLDSNETSTTEGKSDEGVIPRRLFKLKLDYGKHNEPDSRKSVEGVVLAEPVNKTKLQSSRKPFFRTISKNSYSEFDEITEVSSVDSSILSRDEGQYELITINNVDETTTSSSMLDDDDSTNEFIKEIDNQIYQNTPVGLLNPLLALNLFDTTLTPDTTQSGSTDVNFDDTDVLESDQTDAYDDVTTEPSTESSADHESEGDGLKGTQTYRGKVRSQLEVEEDSKTSTSRRPTYRGRFSSTTETSTELNDADVTESTERRPPSRRVSSRRPYQNKNDKNSEQEVNSRRNNRRPLYRSRTEASDSRNESNNDDVQPIRHVARRPAYASRTATYGDEEDSTGNRGQIKRRRPINDETSTTLRNRVRRPNLQPVDGLDDDEERQTNLRGRTRRPIARPALSEDENDESTESPANESVRSDSESISLIRISGRKAIAQIFDEIAATDENVDTATYPTNDFNSRNKVRVLSNADIESNIRTQTSTSNGVVNRRRKIIRRLRPSSTTEQPLNKDVPIESSSIAPRRKIIRKLIRRPSTSEAPYHEANGNIELLPVRGTFGPHDTEKLNPSEEDKEQVSHRRGKSKLFPDIGDDVENYYDNDVFSNDYKNNDTDVDEDEYEVNDEDYENQTNSKQSSSTTLKTGLNSRLYASRAPFSRPTRPTVEHVATTVDSVTSPKSYVRKYSSKFVSPNQPPAEDNSEELSLIGTVKPFVVHENLNRYRNSFKKEEEEITNDDDASEEEDLPIKNVKPSYTPRRPSNRPFSNQSIREDYEEDDQEGDVKFSKPIPLRKQNRPFTSDTENGDEKQSARPSPFNRPKYFTSSKKDDNDVVPDQDIETEDKPNSPYKPKAPRVRTSLPTGTTKSSRKQNNPYTSKKFTSSSSETSSSNPLLDDLDRNALNSRNKKIFEKSSKKHLILNPSTQHQHESIDQTNTSNTSPSNSETSEYTEDYTLTMSSNDGGEYSTLSANQFDDTTQDNLLNTINFNELQEATTEDQTIVFKIGRPTTTPRPTTLHHVFAIDYDEKTEMVQMPEEVEEKTSEVIKKVEKIAEVSRVVEIYSQQETYSNSGDNKSTQSNLVIEKLPTVNKLGEISRITLIKLVEQNKENNSLNEITKPTTLSHSDESKRHAKSIQKLISPETIFSVETSTIPLEALFHNERTSKVLSSVEKNAETSVVNSITTTERTPPNQVLTTDISPTKHVIQIEPLARPLVISLANLDKVVLSKLTNKSSSAGNDSDVQSAGKVSTNVDAPQVDVASNETSKSDSTLVDSIDPIVNTQASYSSEISRVVKKSPKVTEHGVDQPIFDGLEQKEAQPSTKARPSFRPNFKRPPFIVKKVNTTVSNDILPTTESIVPTYQSNRRRRPTTAATASTLTLATIEPSSKNSIKRKYSSRPTIERRRFTASPASKTTTSSTTEAPVTRTEPSRTTNKFFRRRFNYFSTTTTNQPPKNTTILTTESSLQGDKNRYNNVDQKIESSILDSKFVNNRFNQIGENLKDDGLIEAITAISKAPLPVTISATTSKYSNHHSSHKDDNTDGIITDEPITKRVGVNFSTKIPVQEYNPINQHDYDYYDDGNLGIVESHSHSKIKVILHDFGIIECLDQGNFPHPLSCQTFQRFGSKNDYNVK